MPGGVFQLHGHTDGSGRSVLHGKTGLAVGEVALELRFEPFVHGHVETAQGPGGGHGQDKGDHPRAHARLAVGKAHGEADRRQDDAHVNEVERVGIVAQAFEEPGGAHPAFHEHHAEKDQGAGGAEEKDAFGLEHGRSHKGEIRGDTKHQRPEPAGRLSDRTEEIIDQGAGTEVGVPGRGPDVEGIGHVRHGQEKGRAQQRQIPGHEHAGEEFVAPRPAVPGTDEVEGDLVDQRPLDAELVVEPGAERQQRQDKGQVGQMQRLHADRAQDKGQGDDAAIGRVDAHEAVGQKVLIAAVDEHGHEIAGDGEKHAGNGAQEFRQAVEQAGIAVFGEEDLDMHEHHARACQSAHGLDQSQGHRGCVLRMA